MGIIKMLIKELSYLEPALMFILGALIIPKISNIENDSIEGFISISLGLLLVAYGMVTRRHR